MSIGFFFFSLDYAFWNNSLLSEKREWASANILLLQKQSSETIQKYSEFIYIDTSYRAQEPLWESRWPSSVTPSRWVGEWRSTSWWSPANCPRFSCWGHPVKPQIRKNIVFKLFVLIKKREPLIVCETLFTANIVYCLLMHNWFQRHSASESFVYNNALSRLCGVTVKHGFAFVAGH